MDVDIIIDNVQKLYNMWTQGKLGGEYMPEDSNPHLDVSSLENYLYFTLPMALNFQRDSYKLWEGALLTYNDPSTSFVFDIDKVLSEPIDKVREALTKYKVALQPNKHIEIWLKLAQTIKNHFDGDIRKLFEICHYDVNAIRHYIQVQHKKDMPYISGNKICNYWLFVLHQYTDVKFVNICDLTVAPDTHVVKASLRLGVITDEEYIRSDVQSIVIDRWCQILKSTELSPIDIHTPLWLWSRGGFIDIV